MVDRRTAILHNSRLEHGDNCSLDVERRLGVPRFAAELCVDVSTVIIELDCVLLDVWCGWRLKNVLNGQ